MAGSSINRLVLNGNTEFDLTGDTVTPETLVIGATAHDRSGALIAGTADYQPKTMSSPAAVGSETLSTVESAISGLAALVPLTAGSSNKLATEADVNVAAAIKTLTYTGTGTASHSVVFPERPTLLLALMGVSGSGRVSYVPVPYGSDRWVYAFSSYYTSGSGGWSVLTYSADELTMTMAHSDSNGAAACNLAGAEYTIFYV